MNITQIKTIKKMSTDELYRVHCVHKHIPSIFTSCQSGQFKAKQVLSSRNVFDIISGEDYLAHIKLNLMKIIKKNQEVLRF